MEISVVLEVLLYRTTMDGSVGKNERLWDPARVLRQGGMSWSIRCLMELQSWEMRMHLSLVTEPY
jgi:hypothetical protein